MSSERADIADQIATLEAERSGLAFMIERLSKRYAASPPISDEAKSLLDALKLRIDAIGDLLGPLTDQAYGRML